MNIDLIQMFPAKITVKGIHRLNKVLVDGKPLSLKRSLRVANRSPTGFNWGYCGSGPAQLALALLLKYVSRDIALEYYQDLKFRWVASLPQTDFIVDMNFQAIMADILSKRSRQLNLDI